MGEARHATASLRDQAAAERDAVAAQRDRDAEIDDRLAVELGAGLSGDQQLRGQELRARALEGRRRAALDRERAARDRELAARDRDLAARDRRLAEQALEQAGTDELTGARRRGVGLEELGREIERARRTGESLVAAYVDVDGLKRVNDQHGHAAGDELLRDVVTTLRDRMRSYDLLVRLGGDEFLCVLLGLSVEEAQERFGALNAELPPGPTVRSASFGFSALLNGEGAQELIDRADRELLAARAASPRRTGSATRLS